MKGLLWYRKHKTTTGEKPERADSTDRVTGEEEREWNVYDRIRVDNLKVMIRCDFELMPMPMRPFDRDHLSSPLSKHLVHPSFEWEWTEWT